MDALEIGDVGQGIGVEDQKGRPDEMRGVFQTITPGMKTDDKSVDFTTGFTLVDISLDPVRKGGSLRPSVRQTMLYHDADSGMRRLTVGQTDWSRNVRDRYDAIRKAIEQGVQQRTPGQMSPVPVDMMGPGMMPGMMDMMQ